MPPRLTVDDTEVSETEASDCSGPLLRHLGTLVGNRYRLDGLLGAGGCGQVYRATDRISGAPVAVKLLGTRAGADVRRMRREVTALRLLRLPGVVNLLDDGVMPGGWFVVMEIVDGAPFPGARPREWSTLQPVVLSLLETLRRVHALGVVHRDLKPANVLVTAAGRPVVLDFGLASGRAVGSLVQGERPVLGTPAYCSPEQALGEPAGPLSDLYSLGVMLYEALSGLAPHRGDTWQDLVAARLSAEPPPLRSVAPHVPSDVAQVVDRLLSRDAAGRPSSAEQVIATLGGEADATGATRIAALLGQDGGAASAGDLRRLFAGPDRLLHLREDGARVLHGRTGGRLDRIAEEVTRWVHAGLAAWEGERLMVPRHALDRLDEEWTMGGPGHVDLLGGAGLHAFATQAAATARAALDAGLASKALAAAQAGLAAVRHGDAAGLELGLLRVLCEAALADGTARPVELALFELERTRVVGPEEALLEEILRASLRVGHAVGPVALDATRDAGPFDDEALESERRTLLIRAARSCAPEVEREVIDEAVAWSDAADSPHAKAHGALWRGMWLYRSGRFAEAANIQRAAMCAPVAPVLRTSLMINASSALLEAGAFEDSTALALDAVALAADLRHPRLEARAIRMARTAAYRRGDDLLPDLELVEAAAAIAQPDVEALVAATEAGFAMRAGHLDVAASLARRIVAVWVAAGRRWEPALFSALACACEGRASADDLMTSVEAAATCPVPELAVQIVALTATAGSIRAETEARARALVEAIAPGRRGVRLDLLSVRECLDALDGAWSPRSLAPPGRSTGGESVP